jgi:hypothetical protein
MISLAMLLVIWSDETHRPTRDVYLQGFGPSDSDELERIFRCLCEMAVEFDGLRFNSQTLRAQPMQHRRIRVLSW